MTCDMSHAQCWCCWSLSMQALIRQPYHQGSTLKRKRGWASLHRSSSFPPSPPRAFFHRRTRPDNFAKMFVSHLNTQPSAKDMRRAQAKNDALFDQSRRITVSVVPHIGLAKMPFEPRWITFQTSVRTTMREVLGEIHRQLPKIEHPFDITTSGPNPQRLDGGTESGVMNLLDPFESNSLVLRLRIYDPARIESTAKQSIGSRLLNALGRNKEPSRDAPAGGLTAQPGSSTNRPAFCSSKQTAPPSYEAIVSR